MAKYKLDIAPEIDFELIGIATPLPAYRTAYFLNKGLELCLARIDDWEIINNKNNERNRFAFFGYYMESEKMNVYLLANRSLFNGSLLLPEYTFPDYLLLLKGRQNKKFQKEYLPKIKALSHFQTAQMIDPGLLSSVENLIIDDEIIQQD